MPAELCCGQTPRPASPTPKTGPPLTAYITPENFFLKNQLYTVSLSPILTEAQCK